MDFYNDLFSELEPDVEELLSNSDSVERSSVVLHRKTLTDQDSNRLFNELMDQVCWEQREVVVYGKKHIQPRLVAWYGNSGSSYTFSGLTLTPLPWIKPILEIKSVCEKIADTTFNSVLLNQYRDGNDTVGWHSDDEPELGANPTIASVSLGATRRFDLRHKTTKEEVKVLLPSGSMLLMSGATQSEWSHRVPRTKKVQEKRINLTFRRIYHD